MMATYALQNFDQELLRKASLSLLEFDPEGSHGQFYKQAA